MSNHFKILQFVNSDSMSSRTSPTESNFLLLYTFLAPSFHNSQNPYYVASFTAMNYKDLSPCIPSLTLCPHQIVHFSKSGLTFHNLETLLHLAQGFTQCRNLIQNIYINIIPHHQKLLSSTLELTKSQTELGDFVLHKFPIIHILKKILKPIN